jgi:hypothetical protein
MKLRMIAEASICEARWDQGAADRVSREQSAKNLVVTSLTKVRNMLHPMGLLKGTGPEVETPPKHQSREPIHDPEIQRAFELLRQTVRARAQIAAKRIVDGEGDKIARLWGFQVPTNWHDVHAGQMGRATAEGIFDEMIRDTTDQAAGIENDEKGLKIKARLLKDLANEVFRWL